MLTPANRTLPAPSSATRPCLRPQDLPVNHSYRGTPLTTSVFALALLTFGSSAVLSAQYSMRHSMRLVSIRLALYQDSADAAEGDTDQHELQQNDPAREQQLEDPRIGVTIAIAINAVVLIVIAVCLFLAHLIKKRRARKRTADLQLVAADLNLEFRDTGDAALQQELAAFPLFNIGRAHKLTNLFVAETPALKINLFDYEYTTGHGKHKRVRRQTVAAVQSTELVIPDFVMRPERKLDLVGSLLGRQDIDFAEHPAFSKAFVLKSGDETATRDFFDTSLLDYFAAHGTISFEAAQGSFLYFRRWKYVPPQTDSLRDFLAEGHQAFQAIQERLARTS